MKMKPLGILALTCFLFIPAYGRAQDDLSVIPQIPIKGLNDLAMASFSANGPVIYFNPDSAMFLNQTNPSIVKFILAHEFAHHKFGHITKQLYAGNNFFLQIQLGKQSEIEADQYAIDYWAERDITVLEGTVRYMRSPTTANWGDLTHLPTPLRARLIETRIAQLRSAQEDSKKAKTEIDPAEGVSLASSPFNYFIRRADEDVKALIAAPDTTGLGAWDSSVKFPGASRTSVVRGDGGEYSVLVTFNRGSSRDAKETFEQLLQKAKRELGESWRYDVTKQRVSDLATWNARITQALNRVKVAIMYMESRSGRFNAVRVSFTPQ